MRFAKMQGLGNDFVVVGSEVEVDRSLVRTLCHRRFGVGADGLLQVSAEAGLVHMGYWNADGSEAEMCGNGLRCVARRAVDLSLATGPVFDVVTPVGVLQVEVGDEIVTVELGPVELGDRTTIGGRVFQTVSVGNPHAVTIVGDPESVDVAGIGSAVEHNPAFPAGTNVEFIRVAAPGVVDMRVWERGVGETLACGTGIVAAAAVAMDLGGPPSSTVNTRGGAATVEFRDGSAWLSGPAETVFEGEWLSESS